ncbi:hypothetical protein [Brevundimonas sp. A19_0]|uniref:hypothetical protein n=1 Tax=Brevundimonas sp. A19_0 TaxID=2821087 RepID=UPI001ADA0B26|nr:hypothetical protein [Brevundimonas sp. A19_0]MBO9500762.1 hypothetical protein [Brevundimonas sp. A19_0]
MGDRIRGLAVGGSLFDQARGLAGPGGLGRSGAGVGRGDGCLALGHFGPMLGRVERIPAEAETAEDLDAGHGKADQRAGDQDPVDRGEA